MAGRTWTTKQLAQRIDRDYFRKVFPIPRWRRVLSIGVPLIGIFWLGWSAVSGNRIYTAGPLAHGHRIITNNCQSCHAQTLFGGMKTSDAACLACHDGPVHQARQTFTPQCASCHVEHKSEVPLAATPDASCTQCHADLKVKEGQPGFALRITSFSDDHPEFAAVRPGHPLDPGTIKLNHRIHLKSDLKGPDGNPKPLVCADCHQEALAASRSPAASIDPDPALARNASNSNIRSLSPEMEPVSFEKHCMSCHPLVFDERFNPAPHKETQIVEFYLIRQYTDYIALHPGEVSEAVKVNPDLPEHPAPPPPRNAAEWVSQSVTKAERLLWQKSCKECHPLTYPAPSSRPEVPRVNQTVRWMKNAWFDHKPHQLVECTECHTEAPRSQKTEDVLLPAIATCRKCHHEGQNAAVPACYECHVYHDWSKAGRVRNTNRISQVLR